MNRKEFSKSASAAIKEGSAARKAFAERQASRFVNGASDFDPRALSKLGGAGLRRFISIVQDSGTAVEYPVNAVSEQNSSPVVASSAKGWTDKQRAEPSWKARAFIHGTVVGTAIFLFGLVSINALPF
jgi:hypothetical protein